MDGGLGRSVHADEGLMTLNAIIDILLPPVCPVCEAAPIEGVICASCLASFNEQAVSGPLCDVCGTPFISKAAPSHRCGDCLMEKPPFVEARSAFVYDGAVEKAVKALKYGGRAMLARALGGLAVKAVSLKGPPDVIIPVPLHLRRLRARGFNQSLLIARAIARAMPAKVDYRNLVKTRDTKPQAGLKNSERRENVRGAYLLKRPADVHGKRALLVDDVYTTGETVRECSKVLKKAGAEVFVLTLARTVKV